MKLGPVIALVILGAAVAFGVMLGTAAGRRILGRV